MKKITIFALACGAVLTSPKWAFADQTPLTWVTPMGTVGLPITATEALLGYDAILKQAIAGASVPVYTDPKGFVSLELGAVGAWPNNRAGVEPYVALGHDIAKEIPLLAQYNTVHINVFGRYASEQGKAGVGVSFSYSFGGGTLAPANPPATPVPTP